MNMKMIGAAVLAGAMVAGCGKNEEQAETQAQEKKEDVMAVSVNGKKLMQSAIDADVAKVIAAQGSKVQPEQLEYAKQMIANQLVQSFIVENVLLPKAKEVGCKVEETDRKEREAELLKAAARWPDAPKTLEAIFKKTPFGEERARAEFENGILIDKLIKQEQAKLPKKDYAAEAQKIVDNIVSNNTAALKKIKDLKQQLDKVPAAELAKKFAELAKANSACPSSAKGGDLGEFTHGQMVKEFDEVAFKNPVNTVSDPVKTQFGYHLVMVTKKVPAVEAKGDKPAAPEKVQASHILVKAEEVPNKEDVVKRLARQDEGAFAREFIQGEFRKAKIEASEEYKRFLPPTDEPKAPKADSKAEKAKPVEKPAAK